MTDYEVTDYITPEEYMELRKLVGWGLFPLEQAEQGIKNTYILICLRKDGKPIALGRAVSDRGYVVYIADVIVVPEYQGQGLGRVIMEMLMTRTLMMNSFSRQEDLCLTIIPNQLQWMEKRLSSPRLSTTS